MVVVGDVVADEPEQMAFAECDDVVEQLASATPDPAFDERILPRAPIGRAHRLGAHGLHELDHGPAEDLVSIEEQVAWSGIVWQW